MAVVSTAADRGAPVRAEADLVIEVSDFLDAAAVVAAASGWKADLLHPGYGFLSENADFAAAVERAGIAFVGPTPEAMRRLGDKESARRLAVETGVPVLPGLDSARLCAVGDPVAELEREGVGFPCSVKAAFGGGGIGIRVVRGPADLAEAIAKARAEAEAAFGDGTVYLERWLERPRHVEFQVFGDGRGGGIHLGERECSVQRRRQKLVEWSPAFGMTDALRRRMGIAALRLVRESRYRGAGTVGVPAGRRRRLPLPGSEHPAAGRTSGHRSGLRGGPRGSATGARARRVAAIAARAGRRARSVRAARAPGAAVEARVLAESPEKGFAPSPGRVRRYRAPAGGRVRVDSGIAVGTTVSARFDSLLAKVIAGGENPAAAADRLAAALDDTVVHGVETNLSLLAAILRHPDFRAGRAHSGWVEERLDEFTGSPLPEVLAAFFRRERVGEALAAAASGRRASRGAELFRSLGRAGDSSRGDFPRIEPGNRPGEILLSGGPVRAAAVPEPLRVTATALAGGRGFAVSALGTTLLLDPSGEGEQAERSEGAGEVRAPLAGRLVSLRTGAGVRVEPGEVLAVIESMKMHWQIRAPAGGVLGPPAVAAGEAVAAGALLFRVEPEPRSAPDASPAASRSG